MDKWLAGKSSNENGGNPGLKTSTSLSSALASKKQPNPFGIGRLSPPKKKQQPSESETGNAADAGAKPVKALGIMQALSVAMPILPERPAPRPVTAQPMDVFEVDLVGPSPLDLAADADANAPPPGLVENLEAYDLDVDDDIQDPDDPDDGMSFVESLVSLRQEKMSSFVVTETKTSPLLRAPLAQFEPDPRIYSSAMFNTYASRQQRQSAASKEAHFVAAKRCASSLSVLPVLLSRVQYSEGDAKPRTPVTTIRFDKQGVLFAVGGNNGIVRVYDFDECLMRLQRKRSPVRPVVSVDTRRAVSDIAWSLENDDEICVSFAFRPELFIYDLQDLSSPVVTLQIGQTGSSVGHTCVIYMPHAPAANGIARSGGVPEQCVLAGGKSGHIRKWNVRANPNCVHWQVSADHVSPVVSLVEIEGRRLVSLTQSGSVSVWDLEHMSVPSFGTKSAPTLLQRLGLGLSANAIGMTFHPIFASELASFSVSADAPKRRNLLLVQGEIFVTTSRGSVVTVALNNMHELSLKRSTDVGADLLTTSLNEPVVVGTTQNPEDMAALAAANVSPYPCPAQLPAFLGSRLLCCPVVDSAVGLSRLAFMKPRDSISTIMDSKSDSALQTSRVSCAAFIYGGLTRPPPGKPTKLEKVYGRVTTADGKAEPEPCLTLPGHVVSVEHGGTEVVVSRPLDSFLAVASTAASNPSRSQFVFLDWHSRAAAEPVASSASGAASGAHTLAHMQPNVLTLLEPYVGPTVERGEPRVLVRTNLAPGTVERGKPGWGGASLATPRNSRLVACTRLVRVFESAPVAAAPAVAAVPAAAHAAAPAPAAVDAPPPAPTTREVFLPFLTAMACHGSLPYIVTGHADDSVSILGVA